MPGQTESARQRLEQKYEKSYYERPIPKTPLQAAELESEDFGRLRTCGRRLEYVDHATRIVFLGMLYPTAAEASSQLRFYRRSYRDVLARRNEFRIVN